MPFKKITEQESKYHNLEKKSVKEILTDINREDRLVAIAVAEVLPSIERLVEESVKRMMKGGRIFYLGAGTSGRLGVIDASEIPPTFGLPAGHVIGLIAGGDRALRMPIEGAEDDTDTGWEALIEHGVTTYDVVIGIAASGTTPYVLGALAECRRHGILTAGITSNPGAPLDVDSDIGIAVNLGPEYLTGSSRMKSGTAQKMILNMFSTAVMIRIGRVEGNKMVNMQLTNRKLVDRGARMIVEELGVDYDTASELLQTHRTVKNVLVSTKRPDYNN